MGCGLGSLRSSSRYSSLTRLARLLLHPSEHPPTAGVGLFSFLNAENPQDLLVLGASYVKPAATYSHRAPLCPGTHIAAGGRWAADSLRCEVAVLLLTQLALPAYSCSNLSTRLPPGSPGFPPIMQKTPRTLQSWGLSM